MLLLLSAISFVFPQLHTSHPWFTLDASTDPVDPSLSCIQLENGTVWCAKDTDLLEEIDFDDSY